MVSHRLRLEVPPPGVAPPGVAPPGVMPPAPPGVASQRPAPTAEEQARQSYRPPSASELNFETMKAKRQPVSRSPRT